MIAPKFAEMEDMAAFPGVKYYKVEGYEQEVSFALFVKSVELQFIFRQFPRK